MLLDWHPPLEARGRRPDWFPAPQRRMVRFGAPPSGAPSFRILGVRTKCCRNPGARVDAVCYTQAGGR